MREDERLPLRLRRAAAGRAFPARALAVFKHTRTGRRPQGHRFTLIPNYFCTCGTEETFLTPQQRRVSAPTRAAAHGWSEGSRLVTSSVAETVRS